MREYFGKWVERAMTEPDINSRFIFLLHGIAATLCLLALTVGFIVAKDKTGYDMMVLAVGGSGGAAAVGRFLTKKGGGDAAAPAPAPEPKGTRDDG